MDKGIECFQKNNNKKKIRKFGGGERTWKSCRNGKEMPTRQQCQNLKQIKSMHSWTVKLSFKCSHTILFFLRHSRDLAGIYLN